MCPTKVKDVCGHSICMRGKLSLRGTTADNLSVFCKYSDLFLLRRFFSPSVISYSELTLDSPVYGLYEAAMTAIIVRKDAESKGSVAGRGDGGPMRPN